LPISMAAPLGEKERAAAFAAPNPLAWIELCAPLLAHYCAPRPESIFGYDCSTSNSYMLRVMHRGIMDDPTTRCRGRADFVQHGQLALLKQAFPKFFQKLPVGVHFVHYEHSTSNLLLLPGLQSYATWALVLKRNYGHNHVMCFSLFAALTCEPAMFAHPIHPPESTSTNTDAPFCVGGNGNVGKAYSSVTYNRMYTLYHDLVANNIRIII
jgi:hypothetical protein